MRYNFGAVMLKITVSFIALAAVTGCASVAGEKWQPVTVQTLIDDKEVAGVGCTLMNDAGKWFLTTPGSVTVHKSTGDLAVDCKSDDAMMGHETLVSESNGAVWGNLLVGGGIGYIVDRNTGAGFDYPNTIAVALRKVGSSSGATNLVAPPAAPASAASAPMDVSSVSIRP